MKTLIVGCFEVTEIEPGKWGVHNTLNGFDHVTYGTEEEVTAELARQSDRWKLKLAPRKPGDPKPRPGAAWRAGYAPAKAKE